MSCIPGVGVVVKPTPFEMKKRYRQLAHQLLEHISQMKYDFDVVSRSSAWDKVQIINHWSRVYPEFKAIAEIYLQHEDTFMHAMADAVETLYISYRKAAGKDSRIDLKWWWSQDIDPDPSHVQVVPRTHSMGRLGDLFDALMSK